LTSPTQTIAGYFASGGVGAEAALPGSALAGNLYFDPTFVLHNSTGYNAALLIHEVIHNLGPIDPGILAALGFSNSATSDNISKKLAADCFGVKP
jgi:hypothetical protein